MAEHGYIGFDNLFTATGVTVSVTSEVVGFEGVNAIDWKQYDWWKQSGVGWDTLSASFTGAQAADYLCIYGHNLFSIGSTTYKVQHSTDAGATWIETTGGILNPTDDNVIFVQWTSVSAADWRLVIDSTGASSATIIAGVMIGAITNLNRDVTSGFSPPNLSPVVETKTAMSEQGVNLGASVIRTGLKGNLRLSNVTDTWVRAEWKPIIDHLNLGKPVVFAWDATNHSGDAILIWKSSKIPVPSYTSQSLMSVSLPFEGIE